MPLPTISDTRLSKCSLFLELQINIHLKFFFRGQCDTRFSIDVLKTAIYESYKMTKNSDLSLKVAIEYPFEKRLRSAGDTMV
jgi:hypothetical protein